MRRIQSAPHVQDLADLDDLANLDADWGGEPGSRLGLDIGGTLAKLAFFESQDTPSWCNGLIAAWVKSLGTNSQDMNHHLWSERDTDLSFFDIVLGGRFHFVTFRSADMEKFVTVLKEQNLHSGVREIYTAGGGAYKFATLFKERLGISLVPVDELRVVVRGISWLVERTGGTQLEEPGRPEPDSLVSQQSGDDTPRRRKAKANAEVTFPFILVNIGSGVSIVRVDGPEEFERVSGSALGGGTFWGLCRLLCPSCLDFKQAVSLAETGDNKTFNLTVKDIYGGDYKLPNGNVLSGDIVASFFARAGSESIQGNNDTSLLHTLTKMVSQNICQIAYLNARIHKINRVFFTGNFLRQNPVAKEAIAAQMQRVSLVHRQGEPYRAVFLKHEGYFGALGTFLHNLYDRPADMKAARRNPRLALNQRPRGYWHPSRPNSRRNSNTSEESSLGVPARKKMQRSPSESSFGSSEDEREQSGKAAASDPMCMMMKMAQMMKKAKNPRPNHEEGNVSDTDVAENEEGEKKNLTQAQKPADEKEAHVQTPPMRLEKSSVPPEALLAAPSRAQNSPVCISSAFLSLWSQVHRRAFSWRPDPISLVLGGVVASFFVQRSFGITASLTQVGKH